MVTFHSFKLIEDNKSQVKLNQTLLDKNIASFK